MNLNYVHVSEGGRGHEIFQIIIYISLFDLLINFSPTQHRTLMHHIQC